MKKVLIFGWNGWIGRQLMKVLIDSNKFDEVVVASRADNEIDVAIELDSVCPTHVLSMVGRTYGPGYSTIDYLEQPGKLQENVRDNLFAPVVLALLCNERGVHFTYFGTGCIFDGESSDVKGYTEDDGPNFFGSGYSTVKGFTDRLMHLAVMEENCLNVRIRMPITSEVTPRNFITKITTYEKVCSIPNSMSVLHTLFPPLIKMMADKTTGTINLTNPGVISHNEILEMYCEIVDPSFTWKNFTIEEQDKVLASKRSNNRLDTSKLESIYPNIHIPDIHTAVRDCLVQMAQNINDAKHKKQSK